MLPKIKLPTFIATLPTDKKKFKFTPFRSEQHKNVLIASEAGNDSDVLANLIELVNDCVADVDFYQREAVDFEWALLNIRSKAVGETFDMTFKCLNTIDDIACNAKTQIEVDYLKLATPEPTKESIINITDSIKIKLKPLVMKDISDETFASGSISELLYSKVEWVSENENIVTEFSLDEFKEFAKDIPPVPAQKIVDFLSNPASVVLTIPTKCEKCGSESSVTIRGALNFFG